MFSPEELSVIKLKYFNVILCASDICEVESHNGDHWMILKVQKDDLGNEAVDSDQLSYFYKLYRRPKLNEGFHFQSEHFNVLNAVLDIIGHDDNKGRRVRKRAQAGSHGAR